MREALEFWRTLSARERHGTVLAMLLGLVITAAFVIAPTLIF